MRALLNTHKQKARMEEQKGKSGFPFKTYIFYLVLALEQF